jgi:BirA family transcriptional regulator, biotin operon repressor / biotin---[acetyl-CoA-carboxylase] ligase
LLGLPVKSPIGEPFIELSSINSTNIYAMSQLQANLAEHGAAFFAHEQTRGKGQRGKNWQATPGKNLILSVLVDIQPLATQPIFGLHCLTTLACIDLLCTFLPEDLCIKWPNDLYWRDRKAGGILIETVFKKGLPHYAVVGIGVNINEENFPTLPKKAVSLKQITGQTYDPVMLAKQLCTHLNDRYNTLIKGNFNEQLLQFNERLFKRNEKVRLKKNGATAAYLIKEVNLSGELIAEAGIDYSFQFGEIEWIMQ